MPSYLSKLSIVIIFVVLGALVSCGPEALPRQAPETEIGASVERAERAATEARESEKASKERLAESKRQLDMAHAYLKRAEAAAAICKGNYSKVLSNEAARKKAEAAARKRAAAAAAAKQREEELRLKAEAEAKALEEANAPKNKNKEPEFSKSDAP
jgi:dTMP kinase